MVSHQISFHLESVNTSILKMNIQSYASVLYTNDLLKLVSLV